MKVFLRHAKTKLYYSGWHNWTTDLRQAVNFEKVELAVEKARNEMLSQVEALIQDGDPVEEKIVPIPERSKWP